MEKLEAELYQLAYRIIETLRLEDLKYWVQPQPNPPPPIKT